MKMDIQDIILALDCASETYGLSLPSIIRIDAGIIFFDDGTFLSIDELLLDRQEKIEENKEQWY